MSRVTRSFRSQDAPDRPQAIAHLFLALRADQPIGQSAGFALAHETIVIGGGDRVATGRDGAALRITIDDPWMSSTHARLRRTLARWRLEDAGSKNGCLVNGRRARSQILEDGDVVEIGRSFFVFRAEVEPTDAMPPPGDAFRTVLPSLKRELAVLAKIARSPVPVVLQGETGTGKEVVAAAIHALSGRAGELVAFNCGALTETLLQSELFGHRQGAFSGATDDRPGLVRSAHRGSLFLDEVAELSAAAQVALLRVLDQKEVLPVGGTRAHAVDVRFIAASHRDLAALIEPGEFREDLYNRLAGFTLSLPPLRERREDLASFAAVMLARSGAAAATLTAGAARLLLAHDWPGNLRELERALSSAVVVAEGAPIAPEHLPAAIRTLGAAADPAASDALTEEEVAHRAQLVEVLARHAGNIAAVGRELGKAPIQIRRWVRRYAIDLDQFRK